VINGNTDGKSFLAANTGSLWIQTTIQVTTYTS
jgi:hypothetical protein